MEPNEIKTEAPYWLLRAVVISDYSSEGATVGAGTVLVRFSCSRIPVVVIRLVSIKQAAILIFP